MGNQVVDGGDFEVVFAREVEQIRCVGQCAPFIEDGGDQGHGLAVGHLRQID